MCEYAIEVTNGNNLLHVIPMANRLALLQTWVAAKQMAQQQIPKTFGADDEVIIIVTHTCTLIELCKLSDNCVHCCML